MDRGCPHHIAGSMVGSLKLRPSRLSPVQPRSAREAMRTPVGPSLLWLRLRSVSDVLPESEAHTLDHIGVASMERRHRSFSLRSSS